MPFGSRREQAPALQSPPERLSQPPLPLPPGEVAQFRRAVTERATLSGRLCSSLSGRTTPYPCVALSVFSLRSNPAPPEGEPRGLAVNSPTSQGRFTNRPPPSNFLYKAAKNPYPLEIRAPSPVSQRTPSGNLEPNKLNKQTKRTNRLPYRRAAQFLFFRTRWKLRPCLQGLSTLPAAQAANERSHGARLPRG